MRKPTHEEVKKNLLKDPKTRAAYEEFKEEYALIGELLLARQRAGLTQEKIAKKMRTTTSAVSRLESLSSKRHHSPSISTLKRYANAVGCELKVKLVPKRAPSSY